MSVWEVIFLWFAGIAIGVIYFCSLGYFLTTGKGLLSKYPGLWRITFILRLIFMAVAIALVMQGSGFKALVCLLGIILGRNLALKEAVGRQIWN